MTWGAAYVRVVPDTASFAVTPRSADFRWFVVEEVGTLRGGGFDVRVHKNLAYLFEGGHGSADGTRPGWLGALRFSTYEEAVAFGQRLAPIIERAHRAHGEHCGAVGAAISLIYAEYGECRDREPVEQGAPA